jgi:hypothetical protein
VPPKDPPSASSPEDGREQAIRSESKPNVAMQQKCDKTKPEFWAALVNILI